MWTTRCLPFCVANSTTTDKAQLLKDRKYAPAWVANILQRLAAKTT